MPTPAPLPPRRLILDREASRRVDRLAIERFGLTGLVLMENAGRSVAEVLAPRAVQGPVLIACGRGNNGGDGLVVARHLDALGIDPRVALWANPAELAGDAAVNFEIVRRAGLPIEIYDHDDPPRLAAQLLGVTWIVDALLGTGSRGEPRPPLDWAIERLNASGLPILAIDLPSGLDCDTGQASTHTIRARITCTLVAKKPGFHVPGAAAYTGEVVVGTIGVPRALLDGLRDKHYVS